MAYQLERVLHPPMKESDTHKGKTTNHAVFSQCENTQRLNMAKQIATQDQ
jgi:hypothetical protein